MPYTRVGPAMAVSIRRSTCGADSSTDFLTANEVRALVVLAFHRLHCGGSRVIWVDLFRTNAGNSARRSWSRPGFGHRRRVVLPTLVALLGYEIAPIRSDYGLVRYRMPYSLREADVALGAPITFRFIRPRGLEDPLRVHLRSRLDQHLSTDA